MKFFFSFCLLFFSRAGFAQEMNADSLFHPVSPEATEKQVKTSPPNSEKLAWEMMYPFGYKKPEKTPEMRSFEELFLQMKRGAEELSQTISGFNLHSSDRLLTKTRKK